MAEAFATSSASNLGSKLGEYLLAPIGRQFGYVFCYESYVQDLKNGVEKLEDARERVQYSVNEARYGGKSIHTDIKKWLDSVENKAKEAQNLLKQGESAKNACFRGWLPNPMVRHPIGRKVNKMTQVIQQLHDETATNNFQKVYYENPPKGIVTTTTFAARSVDRKDVLESRASITEDVLKAISGDKIYVVGVYGPGGVGKSKLLEDIERRVKKEKLFDVVAMANVSHNPDLKTIQGEIADALGLKLMNVETTRGRANCLRERLKQDCEKRVLIILDDLWRKLELKDVGIPCGDDDKVRGCKLLLSSRDRGVLCTDMSSNRVIQLNMLRHEEARILFERTLGDRDNHLEFEPWVDGVVKNCGGLPLLIVLLAKRLKHSDLVAWSNALTNKYLSDIKSLVELSYKDLKDERIKSLFLFCALNSGRIYVEHSLVCCMGLGLFENFSKSIEENRVRLIMDIRSLQDSSLLLDSDDMERFKTHNMVKFRMHDIFVDVAISIASRDWGALVGRNDYGFKEWSKDELRKCTAISFPWVGIDELPEKLHCPNLRMLLLFENNLSLKIHKSFFESMEKLQVLDLTGFSFTSLPSSIESLENLKSLNLDQCHLEDVTVLGKLKGLQFLSFFYSTIARLPKEIGGLSELRFLDLTGCTELKVIEPGVLGSLLNLQELKMEDSFDQWEAEDEIPRSNASLAELESMKNMSTLSIAIPYSANLPRDLPFGKLNNHKIQIGDVWNWSGEYKEPSTLKLELDSDNLLLEEWVQKCLQKTQDLHLDGLQDGVNSVHTVCVDGFKKLKHLHVQNSPSFHYVVHSIANVQRAAFTTLECLFLKNLNNLETICCGRLAPGSFSKLNIVKVENCGGIKHLFPLSMERTISKLEEIEISKCHLMQQIVADAETDEDGDEIDDDTEVKSCNLRRLTLRNLLKMTSFCKTKDHPNNFFDGQQVSLPWLESLTLSELPKLKEIWNSQFPSDISNLKFLKVEDCALLMGIFPSNLVIKLQNLEAIIIERCQVIRKLFDLEGLIASGDVEILSRLTTLILSDLPRLEHIWNKNPRTALCFRNLRVLEVQGCENLRFIFSSSMAKALQQIKEIKIARCKLLEEIMEMQEEESKKAAFVHTLEFPLLSSLSLEELPNLRTFSHETHCIHCPTLTRLTISGCPKMITFSSFKGKQQTMTTNTGLQQALGGVNSSLSLPILFNQNILFPSLEELTIVSCGLMEIWHNGLSKKSFCKLASITIRDCENLSRIFPSTIIEVFQSLKMIEVVNCASLESLMEQHAVNTKSRPKSLVFLELNEVKLWDLPKLDALVTSSSQATLSLPSLTTVSLRNCHSLRYLFTYNTSKTLDKLEMLDVSDCNKMQEAVSMEESEVRKLKAMKFPRLHTLKLCYLKSLISFSSGSCAFEFPSLRNLSILECTKLKAFILRQLAPRVETMNGGSVDSDESLHFLFDEKVLFPSLKELKLSSMCQLKRIWHNQLHGQSFCKLASLTIELCENLSHVFPSNSMDRLQSLSKIEVVGCPSLEALFEPVSLSLEDRQRPLELFALQKMKLLNLPRLTNILKGDCEVTLTFPSLMEVNIKRCHSLSYLFSSTTAKTLHKLEVLDVSRCNNLRGIIVMEEGKGKTSETFEFRHLVKLKLGDLKSLICFSSKNCVGDGLYPLFDEKLAFPKLEELHIKGVQQEELWNSKILVESFRCLKALEVKQCHNLVNVIPSFMSERLLHYMKSLTVVGCPRLRNLFTMSMAKSLRQLQYLGLGGCGEMEYIVTKEEEKLEEATDKIVIPQLVSLYLHNMSKLRSFCQEKHISKWPSLKEFTIEDCKAVKVILGDASCRKLEGSNPTHQPLLLVEKVEFPSMESMKISHMDNIEKIWLDDLNSNAFGKLKTLIVEYCEKLLSIFSSYNMLTRFRNLEKITMTNCGSLEVVFQVQEFEFSKASSTNTFQLRELILTRLSKMKYVWSGLPQGGLTFGRLQCMKVVKCESLKSLFPSLIAKSMTHLKELLVQDCEVEDIIVEEDGVGMSTDDLFFPQLIDLRLLELPKLRSFYRNSHTLAWPLLKQLRVRHCGKMRSSSFACESQSSQDTITIENQYALFSFEKVISHLEGSTLTMEDVMMIMPQHYVFRNLRFLTLACYHDENVAFPSNFLLHRFPILQELMLICSPFEEIFPRDSSEHWGVTPCEELTNMEKPLLALQNLKRLNLIKLCNLKQIWKDGSLMTEILKQIEVLRVRECPRLPIVLPSLISFQRLTYLRVEDCSGLVHMGTCLVATSLVHLTWLSLRNCGAMEDVITEDGNEAGDISFPKLEKLILDDLPSLESFSNTNRALRFLSLVSIVITKCPKMNIFCKGALRTPKLDKILLSKEDDEGHREGNLNTTIQTLYALNNPQRIQ